nr:hypothetical protein [Agrobacterium rosae]MDX8316910.1 hypothetical protein [Agrobacterium rosae]MDX8316917.1 hypothetical protein [Agrobacterium rosae]
MYQFVTAHLTIAHGIQPNQVFAWRNLATQAALTATASKRGREFLLFAEPVHSNPKRASQSLLAGVRHQHEAATIASCQASPRSHASREATDTVIGQTKPFHKAFSDLAKSINLEMFRRGRSPADSTKTPVTIASTTISSSITRKRVEVGNRASTTM